MRPGRITRAFIEGFRDWDARTKTAFVMAVVLFVAALAIGRRLPQDQQPYAVIGIVGLLIAMQVIFLYANRGMVTHVTKAQRLILTGRYQEAVAVLGAAADGRQDAQSLTLLGNAYRMLGRVDDSLRTLSHALELAPDGHFQLYSLGRTLMARGDYTSAADYFRRALGRSAPLFAQVDFAEASLRAGEPVEPFISASDEPHVALMAAFVLWRAGHSDPPNPTLIESGLPYWEQTAARFVETPYGRDLQHDLTELRALTGRTRAVATD